ncbi:MAG TPA: dihydrofolate reductase family protein [Microlunatus sp.]|nr:dihydrofolate reductase family protein [Microlunatus sp.]
MSISLDGYVAGPSQSAEDPLGRGGLELHQWLFAGEAADYLEEANASAAAFIMGRHMFGPGRGEWDLSWEGWWGGNPFNGPVFVLTHYERDTLIIGDDAPFHFVTSGIVSALEQAQAVAEARDVMIVGGAQAIRQYLAAGLLDELRITVTPVILGAGERLLDGIGHPKLAQLESVSSGSVTHLRYGIER